MIEFILNTIAGATNALQQAATLKSRVGLKRLRVGIAMMVLAVISLASCDSRKKFNVQELEGNFKAAIAIKNHTGDKYSHTLPKEFAHISNPYSSAKRALEIFDTEIANGQLVFIDKWANSTDNPLAFTAASSIGKANLGRTYDEAFGPWKYISVNGILCRAHWPHNGDYLEKFPFYFTHLIDDDRYKQYFIRTYGISEELTNSLGDLSYTKRTKHFIADYENTVLSLTKPEMVSESESTIVHKVKDINSGYVFYVTQEWSADGTTSKKSFKMEKE